MKNKRNTGLCAGVYRESSNQKSTLFDLLASILIFLALAADLLHGKRLYCNALSAGCRRSDLHCSQNHPAFRKNEAAVPHSVGGTAARCPVCTKSAAERFRRGMEYAA